MTILERSLRAKQPPGAKALGKGLDVLETLGAPDRELTLTDLMKALRFTKTTAHRIVSVLEARGYLERDRSAGAYRIGLKVWQLGYQAINRLRLREVARPFLEGLARKTEEHVNLAVLDGTDAVFVDIIESAKPIRPYTYVGGRVPAYCSATGKAMIAFQPKERVAAVIKAGLKPFTERTIVQAGRLREELRLIRAAGYAVNREEWREDVCGLAAPVRNHENQIQASVSITTPASRFDEGQFRPLVMTAAREISEAMGWLGEKAGAGSRQRSQVAGPEPAHRRRSQR